MKEKNGKIIFHAAIENPGKALAFFIQLSITRGKDGEPIAPSLWSENYFSLMPGETKEVKVVIEKELTGKSAPHLKVEGWNIEPVFIKAV